MLLLSIILFGLCSTITANAVSPKIDIKSKLNEELQKLGVSMNQYCEFQVNALTFNKTVIEKNETEAFVKTMIEDLKPLRKSVDDQVAKLYEQKGSEASTESLAAVLVDFAKIILLNEVQLLQNFPVWVAEDKARAVNNSKCTAEATKEQIDQLNSLLTQDCGPGELELDANRICKNIAKFQCAINSLTQCQGQDPKCVEGTKSKCEENLTEGVDDFEAIYSETSNGLRNEEERNAMCLVLAISVVASDKENPANSVATCILEDMSKTLNLDLSGTEGDD